MSVEETIKTIKQISSNFESVKTVKGDKSDSLTKSLKEILDIKVDRQFKVKKSKEENQENTVTKEEKAKVLEEHYLALAVMIEFLFDQKLSAVINNLNDDQICQLNQFFFITYQRISKKQDVKSLKPTKLFPLHQELIAKAKIGMIHRSLFSTLK